MVSLLTKEKKKFVRIIIGKSFTGHTGVMAPVKHIRIKDCDVKKVHAYIEQCLKKF